MTPARRCAWAGCLALAPLAAGASDGLSAMAAYLCDPVPMTAAVIDRCLRASPALQAPDRHLLRDWQDRNAPAIKQLTQRCDRFEAGLAPQEREHFRQRVRALNAKEIARQAAEIDAQPARCETLLGEIAAGQADLQRWVDKGL